MSIQLSDEQQKFIDLALQGNNILVDACIGSGKTTTIQQLCNQLPREKKVLYLTYNRLLKLDARSKIQQKNVKVTNYHGFAYGILKHLGISVGRSDLIQTFNKIKPEIAPYDVLIIDEYQDIELELSEMLEIIKNANPKMQIVAVGDMEQKIYDKTTLDVSAFIHAFLDNYIRLEFTKCFRLPPNLAQMLGRVWHKKIVGVNDSCSVLEMTIDETVKMLSEENPADILCLGSRTQNMAKVLNILETNYPYKFNKSTVFASIDDRYSDGATEPKETSAIFTTYDKSKGLERKICVIFDFTEDYWSRRIQKPQTSYEILRNIFCVAASRGKSKIVFVKEEKMALSEKTLSTYVQPNCDFKNFGISGMFDFKYKEDVEKCFELLDLKKLNLDDNSTISISNHDELIDLSPCIGIYQEATFFENYKIDVAIKLRLLINNQLYKYTEQEQQALSLDQKILYLTALETKQKRYRTQVEIPFVSEDQKAAIIKRLGTVFTPDENAQVECKLPFAVSEDGSGACPILGYADVVKDDTVYELKFVRELMHEHFLQCACYMVALKLKKGILWNTMNNTMYEISIRDEKKFLDSVINAITKGVVKKYIEPKDIVESSKTSMDAGASLNFAVIDTETTYDDEVMSIGVVIADGNTMEVIDSKYYLLDPEYRMPGMYSYVLMKGGTPEPIIASRQSVIKKLINYLNSFNVKKVLAYNASFDKGHLPELDDFCWCEIMRLAAYKQYNKYIPKDCECFKSGKMKRGYGVEEILRMLGIKGYQETHNAYFDALDEFKIVKLLGHSLDVYDVARLDVKRKAQKTQSDSSTTSGSKRTTIRDEKSLASFDTTDEHSKKEDSIVEPSEKRTNEFLDEDIISKANIEVLTTAQAADFLGVSHGTVYNLIKNGSIEALKINGRYEILKSSVEDYQKQEGDSTGAFLIQLVIACVIVCFIVFFL